MKILHTAILVAGFLCSCKGNSSNGHQSAMSKADSFVARFVIAHPDMGKNDISFQETEFDFSRSLDSFLKDPNALSGMPFIVKGIKQKDAGYAYVYLENASPYYRYEDEKAETFEGKPALQNINLNLFAIMPMDSARLLRQSDYHWYRVEGSPNLKPVEGGLYQYTNDLVLKTEPGISGHGSLGRSYDFGSYLIETKGLKEVPKHYY